MPELSDSRGIPLIAYWQIIVARRWMVAALISVAVCSTWLKSVLESRLYEAHVEIFALAPAWENDEGVSLAPVIPNLGIPFRALQLSLAQSIYWELYSRMLLEAIVEEFDLQSYYGTNSLAQAVAILESQRSIQLANPARTLRVRVVDRDPHMAAALANAHARHLDLLDRRLLAQAASLRWRFIEARVRESELKLAEAEEAWLPLQLKVAVADGAEFGLLPEPGATNSADGAEDAKKHGSPLTRTTMLKLQAMELEAELAGLRRFATAAHPQVTQLEAHLNALRLAIDRLEHGRSGDSFGAGKPGFVLSLADLPEVVLPSQRLAREVGTQERYYLLWRLMLEDMVVEQDLNLPRVWVLDHAVPEERPRCLWQKIIVAGGFALVIGVLLSFLFTYLDRLEVVAVHGAPARIPEL